MSYLTRLDSNFLNLGADGELLSINDTSLVNLYGPGTSIDKYDVGDLNAPGADRLESGETFHTVDNGTVDPAEYTFLGTTTISNGGPIDLNAQVAGLTAQVNPLSGSVVTNGTDHFFLTDMQLNSGHVSVTLSLDVLGQSFKVTAPISDAIGQLTAQIDAYDFGPVGEVAAGLVVTTLNASETLIQGTLNNVAVSSTLDEDGTYKIPPDELFCFCAGTMIETDRGSVAVEDLRKGDMIATRDNGFQPVRWTGSVKVSRATLRTNPKLRPIRIKAGALGQNLPSADLLVSPQHRVLVRSKVAVRMFDTMEVLIAAKQLLQLDGVDIADDLPEVEYFHFLLDGHEVVTSNGAPTESLFTGSQALKAVGAAAREEIFTLFPELRDADYQPTPARPLPSGRMARKLAIRHLQNRRPVYSN